MIYDLYARGDRVGDPGALSGTQASCGGGNRVLYNIYIYIYIHMCIYIYIYIY